MSGNGSTPDESAFAPLPPRQALITAARLELRSRPANEISMQRVADRAGLSRRTLYNQFADRNRLFEALIEELLRDIESSSNILLIGNSLDDLLLGFCRQLMASVEREAHRELLEIVAKGEIKQASILYRLRVRDPLAVMLERRLLKMAMNGLPMISDIGGEIDRLFDLITAFSIRTHRTEQLLITPPELAAMFAARIRRKPENELELRRATGQ